MVRKESNKQKQRNIPIPTPEQFQFEKVSVEHPTSRQLSSKVMETPSQLSLIRGLNSRTPG